MSHKSVRKTVGAILIVILVISMPRIDAIVHTIEVHPAVGVALLLCAVTYVAWGMFWD